MEPTCRPGPHTAEAIDWERYPRRLPVRIIEVPARFHARIENSDVIPLHEYIAKNVGVRRAHGSFVLATNPDLLYSKPLLRLLARGRLADDCSTASTGSTCFLATS